MITVHFKNLEKSLLAKEAAISKVNNIIQKFPSMKNSKIKIFLEMQNSPIQAGPDLFKVKVYIASGFYSGIVIQKSHSNLYVALAYVSDYLLERLNRFSDKIRIKARNNARKIGELHFE